MSTTAPANPTTISWTDPTTNVDGTPIAAGEITGYAVGVRSTTASGSAAGTYPYTASAPSSSSSELLSALTPLLTAGTYVAAVQAVTAAGNSAWSAESSPFTITEIPNPPSNVLVS